MQVVKVSLGSCNLVIQLDTEAHAKNDILNTKRHCNAMYEVHIALRGLCEMYVDNHLCKLCQGSALLISPGVYHNLKDASDDLVHFAIPFSMNNPHTRNLPYIKLELSEFSLAACKRIEKEKKEKNSFYQENLKSLYTLLLSEVLRAVSQTDTGNEKSITIETDRRFAVIDNFFEHLHEENQAEDYLASMLNLSRRQLNRVLINHYGMCFRDMVRHTRMDRAAWLLSTTDLPVGEIAGECGYLSETSFFKAFKAHYGMSPMKYRQSSK